jgi:hypothetical protein
LELVGFNAWSKAQVYNKGMPGLLRFLRSGVVADIS